MIYKYEVHEQIDFLTCYRKKDKLINAKCYKHYRPRDTKWQYYSK